MSTQAYVGVIVFLFILLLLGWSKSLFWFVGGVVIGVMGVRMYDSEVIEKLSVAGGAESELTVNGIYSTHPIVLIEKLATGKEKMLRVKNIPDIPREKKVPEYPLGVTLPCYVRDKVSGVRLKMILVRQMKSKKNLLLTARKNGEYYLDLSPQYTKRDKLNSIIGTYALRVKARDAEDDKDNPQKSEKHSRLLELLAQLLKNVWCGKQPEGLLLMGASKHSATIPDQGPVALLSNVPAQMHSISGADIIRGEEKIRGNVKVTYDDETINMPVVEKHYPSNAEIVNMPMYVRIKEAAENAKLLIVIQDYITGGLAQGSLLPKNVIYIGQALRIDPDGKVYLNAFINPLCYDYILLTLQLMLNKMKAR